MLHCVGFFFFKLGGGGGIFLPTAIVLQCRVRLIAQLYCLVRCINCSSGIFPAPYWPVVQNCLDLLDCVGFCNTVLLYWNVHFYRNVYFYWIVWVYCTALLYCKAHFYWTV